jgi:hypothetical protein
MILVDFFIDFTDEFIAIVNNVECVPNFVNITRKITKKSAVLRVGPSASSGLLLTSGS